MENMEKAIRGRLTLVHKGDALVTGVVPGLCSKTGVALPDLHLGAVGGGRASVETVVGTG